MTFSIVARCETTGMFGLGRLLILTRRRCAMRLCGSGGRCGRKSKRHRPDTWTARPLAHERWRQRSSDH